MIKSVFADKGNKEQDWGAFFVTSSTSHFFNKINFEQYLFHPLCT